MVESANQVFKKNHFDQFGLPKIDPLLIEKMDIEQGGNNSVQIHLKFRKVNLFGLSDARVYKISGFQADPERNKLEIKFKTPLGVIEGPYSINGKILVLPIQGKGNIKLELQNLDITLKFLTKKVVKNGKIFMEIEKSKFSYDVTGGKVNFTNLFNGDKALGDNMNAFLNENWKILLEELRKPISTSFSEVFKNLMNKAFEGGPYEEFFEH
jgi:hypothetical protein